MEILCYVFSIAVICAIIGIYCLTQISYKAKDDAHNKQNLARVRRLSILLLLIAFLNAVFWIALVRNGRAHLSAEAPLPPVDEAPPPPPPLQPLEPVTPVTPTAYR